MKKIAMIISTAIITIGTTAATLMMPAVVCAQSRTETTGLRGQSYEEDDSFRNFGEDEFLDGYTVSDGQVLTGTDGDRITDGDKFLGNYACGRAFIEITRAGEGYFVRINWGCSAYEVVEWTYGCYYDNASGTLIANGNGTKADIVFKDEGAIDHVTVEYTDGSAQFMIVGGNLIWEDLTENAASQMIFEKV